MIIELLGKTADFQSSNIEKLNELVCELLRTHRRGNHLVIIPREAYLWLSENLNLNGIERATLVRIKNDFTQSSGLRNLALIRLTIDVAHRSGPVVAQNQIIVGILDAINSDIFEPTQLVVEDAEYDGNLYVKILDSLKAKINAPSVQFELRNGGGQSAYNVWKQQIKAKRIACLLVDSDRSHYDDCEKPALKAARDDIDWPFCCAVCLPCREIENLLPISVLEQLPFALDKALQIRALIRIQETEAAAGTPPEKSFLHYYDLKIGIGGKPLQERFPGHIVEWWESKIRQGGDRHCYSGFGNNIVKYLLDNRAALHSFLQHVRADLWWQFFGEVFALILWFGFAPRRQAT